MNTREDPRWLALSSARRDALLEKHRYTNVEFDWWDSVYEQFVEKLSEMGIEVETRPRKLRNGKTIYEPEIFFTGFYSQGDGACFNGHVSDWTKLLTAMGEEKFIKEATNSFNDWFFICRTTGRYCHSNTMQFDGEVQLEPNPFDEDDQLLQYEAWVIGKPTESDADALYERLKEKFVELADQLYADLEAEHDYLTSDEQVIEFILNHALDELTEDEEEDEACN